jgi:hypothetical protein
MKAAGAWSIPFTTVSLFLHLARFDILTHFLRELSPPI